MATSFIGSLPSTGVNQGTKRTYRTLDQKVVEYAIKTSDEATFLAGYTIGTSTSDGLILAEVDTEAHKNLTRVRLVYVTAEELTNIRYGGTGTSKSSDASVDNVPQYSYTQIVNSFTFSEANIIDGVGSLSNPTGMTSPTASKWRKTGKSVSPAGDKYQIVETWEYVP